MKEKAAKKKNNITTYILVAIMVVGIGILVYPTVSEWWNEKHSTRAIASYVAEVESKTDTEKTAILEAARSYNESLSGTTDFQLDDEEYAAYEETLDISGTGIMGYIQIPSINVNLPIYHGTEDTVLQVAVGHIAGSSLPVGGKGTHAVLSGHRGLPSAKLFTDLDKLVEGDIFTITVMDEVLTYQIDQIHIVLPEETADLAIDPEQDYVTLVTCTPYGINTHRMLVRGHRIDNLDDASNVMITSEASMISSITVFFVVAALLLAVVLLAAVMTDHMRGGRHTQEEILRDLHTTASKRGEKNEETGKNKD